MDINLPGQNDVYSLGYSKTLQKSSAGFLQEESPTVYDTFNPTQAQTIALGALYAGANNTIVVMDPSKGFWLGSAQYETAPFKVNMQGEFAATAANIAGTITAAAIDIPNATTTNSFHVESDGDTFWGTTSALFTANNDNAPAYVLKTGAAKFQSVILASNVSISGIANNTATDISILEKTHNITFSVTDADTIAWTSGTVTLSNGRTFSISSGNTGNMAALTYIYIDPTVSTTVLQTTTTATTAMGANKILLGTAQNHTVTAHFIPYGPGQPLIDGANIGALSIVAGNIAATTITAAKLSVSQLSAITADLGAITAGTVTIDTAGYLRGGQTAYNTGTGFFLGYSTAAYKFSIGDASSNFLTWDGTSLNISGSYITYSAGDISLAESNSSTSTTNTVDTKVKEIAIGQGSGTLRVSFDLNIEASTEDAFGRIYRNGVGVGTQRSNSTDSPAFTNYSEDIAGWSAGDMIQLYIHSSGGGKQASAQNFKVKANKSLIPYVIT